MHAETAMDTGAAEAHEDAEFGRGLVVVSVSGVLRGISLGEGGSIPIVDSAHCSRRSDCYRSPFESPAATAELAPTAIIRYSRKAVRDREKRRIACHTECNRSKTVPCSSSPDLPPTFYSFCLTQERNLPDGSRGKYLVQAVALKMLSVRSGRVGDCGTVRVIDSGGESGGEWEGHSWDCDSRVAIEPKTEDCVTAGRPNRCKYDEGASKVRELRGSER